MRIAICDDDEVCRRQALDIVKEYIERNKDKDISVVEYRHPEDVIEATHKSDDFDIYILDIVMSGMNGIELGLELRETGHNGKIIYLTTTDKYAIDAFKVKAFNYLLKPVAKETLLPALEEAVEAVEASCAETEKSLIVKTKESRIKLSLSSIMYAELSSRTVIYHLTNGRSVESVYIRTTFSEATDELLDDRRFTLCGASMVVNMRHITGMDKESIIFKETYRVYLGVKNCRKLRAKWEAYSLSEAQSE